MSNSKVKPKIVVQGESVVWASHSFLKHRDKQTRWKWMRAFREFDAVCSTDISSSRLRATRAKKNSHSHTSDRQKTKIKCNRWYGETCHCFSAFALVSEIRIIDARLCKQCGSSANKIERKKKNLFRIKNSYKITIERGYCRLAYRLNPFAWVFCLFESTFV